MGTDGFHIRRGAQIGLVNANREAAAHMSDLVDVGQDGVLQCAFFDADHKKVVGTFTDVACNGLVMGIQR